MTSGTTEEFKLYSLFKSGKCNISFKIASAAVDETFLMILCIEQRVKTHLRLTSDARARVSFVNNARGV